MCFQTCATPQMSEITIKLCTHKFYENEYNIIALLKIYNIIGSLYCVIIKFKHKLFNERPQVDQIAISSMHLHTQKIPSFARVRHRFQLSNSNNAKL